MQASPTAGPRRLDLVVLAELAVLLAGVMVVEPTWWPFAAPALVAAAVLGLRHRGSGISAYGLTALLSAAAVAVVCALPQRPVGLLLLSLVLMQLSLYQRWRLVALHGMALALAPLWLPTIAPRSGLVGLSIFLLLQTAFVSWAARRAAHQAKALFDVEFLVLAMGGSGRIRLDLDVLRAETATGQRLKDIQDRVAQTLQQVRRSAQAASTAASTLQHSGQGLTERTQRSSRELGEAAMTLEQIAVIVKDSADAAMAARRTAQAATDLAREVGGIVGEMTTQMQAIDTGARRITDIIGVINGIAFQTNLLALNAAVEAARAGAHGRGFAVVAAEVRMLAQRVTKAATEVKGVIDESVQATRRGNELANTAGSTMGRMIDAVTRVDSTFHSLSADTHEHAAGLVALRDAMFQMRDSTVTNLNLAEQSQGIADALADRARELDVALAQFRLAGDGVPADAVAVAEPAAAWVPALKTPRAVGAAPTAPTAAAPPAEQAAVEFF